MLQGLLVVAGCTSGALTTLANHCGMQGSLQASVRGMQLLVPVCRLVRLPWLECVWVQPCVCVAHIPAESWCWGWVLVKDGGLTHSGRLLRNPQAGGMWEDKAKCGYSSVRDDCALFWAKASDKRLRVVWFCGFGILCGPVVPVCKLVRVESLCNLKTATLIPCWGNDNYSFWRLLFCRCELHPLVDIFINCIQQILFKYS